MTSQLTLALKLALCFAITSEVSLANSDIGSFEKCYKERATKIPTAEERAFLDAYLAYLKTGSRESGQLTITKMKDLAKSQGGQFSVRWVSIFEGAIELCCGGPATCTESFGSSTLKRLLPRIQKGWVTAIELVLTYQQLAKTDGADAQGLKDYLQIINEKHRWALHNFRNRQ